MVKLEAVKRLIIFAASLTIVFIVAAILVTFGRGYRLNLDERKISGTGILSITSIPDGATIYINDEEKGGTDTSVQNLEPGKYEIRLVKEGYSSWEKEIEIVKEKITPIEALLFQSAPNLEFVTSLGVVSPKVSPDGQKIAYGIGNKEKEGLWVLEMGGRQLIFDKPPQQIAKDSDDFTFSNSQFTWSPDNNSILTVGKNKTGKERGYLLDAENLNESFEDISSEVKKLKEQWQEEEETKNAEKLKKLGKEAEKLTKGASKIIFSPDEERVLILKANEKPVVYDSNPSLAPGSKPKTFEIPQALDYSWLLSTSRHLVLVKEDLINIVESDGQNNVTIYTGNFAKDTVFSWPDGSKIVILTNLNTSKSNKPNLYSISLR
jgi:dipeptidyl aminopeptidase/acylaminoacyl peptidase